MSKVITTPKGTELPILDLRGKPYLQGAHRLVWLNEEVNSFTINTEFLLITDDQTIARTTLTILDKDGKMVKQATATKRETKKDFSDHTEKAESSSLFRALAMLGFGTQYATVEMDEGQRIVDSPTLIPKKKAVEASPVESKAEGVAEPTPVKKSTFRKPSNGNAAVVAPVKVETNKSEVGWE